MSVIYIVLPLALLLGGLAVAAFIWTVRSGQLDDLDSPSLRAVSGQSPVATTPEPWPAAAQNDRSSDPP